MFRKKWLFVRKVQKYLHGGHILKPYALASHKAMASKAPMAR
jgi:hypothetical protein